MSLLKILDKDQTLELIERWNRLNHHRKHQLCEQESIVSLRSTIYEGRLLIGVKDNLRRNPNSFVIGLDEHSRLVVASGFPMVRITEANQWYQENSVQEARQFQLRAAKKNGKEDVSDWYDEEDTVNDMKNEIDKKNEYESSYILKRIKEMEEDENDSEETPTLENKIRGGPAGKGKKLGTQVHKDKKKEKSKKAARGKVRESLNESVTPEMLSNLEVYLNSLFSALNIDVNFSQHFVRRVADERNKRPITYVELNRIFQKTYEKYGRTITKMSDQAQAVIADMKSDIHMPFIVKHNSRSQNLDLIAKTVIRKKNFTTPHPKFKIQ